MDFSGTSRSRGCPGTATVGPASTLAPELLLTVMLDSRGSGTSPNATITTFGAVCTSAPAAGTALCGSAWAPAVTDSSTTATQARVAATANERRLLTT